MLIILLIYRFCNRSELHVFDRNLSKEVLLCGEFVILPVENQQEVHYGMVIRNMMYDALTYTEQTANIQKEHREKKDLKGNGPFLSGMLKEDKLKPVIPLVFYYGEEPWDAAMDLHSILKIPDQILKFKKIIPNYHLNVVHVGNVQPKNFKTGLREVFELLQFAKEKKSLNEYLDQHNQRFSNLDDETSDMILLFLGGKDFGKLLSKVELVCKKLKRGKCSDEIASDMEEDVEYIQFICEIAKEFEPEYKCEDICRQCMESLHNAICN